MLNATQILASIPSPIMIVGKDLRFAYINPALEQLFDTSAASLMSTSLDQLIAKDHPIFLLMKKALERGSAVTDHGLTISSPLIGQHQAAVMVAPFADSDQSLIINLLPQDRSQKFSDHWKQRSVVQTMDGLVAMLGHEIKNPLSGIKGAAQLLEMGAQNAEDQELTQLIVDETDRIAALVDTMEAFTDPGMLEPKPINIHKVLQRVKMSAQAGFGGHVEFDESFDPSLPDVSGDENSLIQIVMNLVKNAAEALLDQPSAQIRLSTRYQHGVVMSLPGSGAPMRLPLSISVADNGPGIPEDMRNNLFTPFKTTKPKGKGLGLALVSKMVQDLNGVIEFSSEPGFTEFRLFLPEYHHVNRHNQSPNQGAAA